MLVEVVAVRIIGADDEAELRYRGEGRRPGADGHASVTEQPAQPGLPALFGRLVGAEHGDVRETRGLETGVQHRELTVVGHEPQHGPARRESLARGGESG